MKNAYDSMLQSNREAAQILSTYGCSACTDITGFGLMGHLLEMIKFDDNNDNDDDQIIEDDEEKELDNGKILNGDITETENSNLNSHDNNNLKVVEVQVEVQVAVRLSIKAVPILVGATECINDGIFSSLQPQNIRCSRAVGNLHLGKSNSSYPLLYDPQVCTYVRSHDHHLLLRFSGYFVHSSFHYCKNID